MSKAEGWGKVARMREEAGTPEALAERLARILRRKRKPTSLEKLSSKLDRGVRQVEAAVDVLQKRGQRVNLLEETRVSDKRVAGIISNLRSGLKEKQAETEKLERILGSAHELTADIITAVNAAQPYAQVAWKSPRKPGHAIVPVLQLSDWQIGEVVSRAETEGFGQFNFAIAERRVFDLVDRFVRWVHTHRSGFRIDNCAVFGLGDWVSGDIHDELRRTNEFPLPVQTAKAGYLYGELLRRLEAHFRRVDVWDEGADNHGRLTIKGQFKMKALNNMSYLVRVIAQACTKRCVRLHWRTTKGMKLLANVAGNRFLLEHGDTVRGWMGIPYYGLEREQGREARRRMNTQRGFHYQAVGHWHVPAIIAGNIIVNGSLPGTNEYDHAVGRHAAPTQVAYMVHPKYGVFNFTPFRLR
ncbi:MAG: hypothetical protein ACREDU_02920 [Methylocella sp.]